MKNKCKHPSWDLKLKPSAADALHIEPGTGDITSQFVLNFSRSSSSLQQRLHPNPKDFTRFAPAGGGGGGEGRGTGEGRGGGGVQGKGGGEGRGEGPVTITNVHLTRPEILTSRKEIRFSTNARRLIAVNSPWRSTGSNHTTLSWPADRNR